MSNYFDIYCRTCNVKGDVFHANWGEAQIQRYATHLPELAVMARALHTVHKATGGHVGERRDITDTDTISDALLTFALQHEGHDVAARSEYGNFYDRCSDFYRCPTCSTSHACQRTPGHEGDHGPRHTP